MAKNFFPHSQGLEGWIFAFLLFGIGFLSRPFGSIMWGIYGDHFGRRNAFISSILLMTIPTFLMGFLPTYQSIGYYAPTLLLLLRLFQSLPAAAEAPGTLCFLYENAHPTNKRFMASWEAIGNQIGAIIGIIEAFFFDYYMDYAFLETWGWRLSFIIGGLIGLLGIYLRSTLHETPVFQNLAKHHHTDPQLVTHVFSKFSKTVLIACGFMAINASTFYLIAVYFPSYLTVVLKLSSLSVGLIMITVISATTILLPTFGWLAEKVDNRKMYITAVVVILLLVYPIYIAFGEGNVWLFCLVGVGFILALSAITSILAFQLAHMFPAYIRYTGVGLAFSITDGFVGGFTPAISLLLVTYTGGYSGIAWIILVTGLISLSCARFFKP